MVHRDIKPENILISCGGPNAVAVFKICDLGFTKPLSEDGVHYVLSSGLKGTEDYMAPEILLLRNMDKSELNQSKCTKATDTFAAGCTIFYFLTKGKHPFGIGHQIQENILEDKPVNLSSALVT